MQAMTVREIAAAVGGVWLNPSEDAPEFTSVSTDSRKIPAGCLFIPLVGEKFDGHNFIDPSLEAGAAGCLWRSLRFTLLTVKPPLRPTAAVTASPMPVFLPAALLERMQDSVLLITANFVPSIR